MPGRLVIDIGNTTAKAAVFKSSKLHAIRLFERLKTSELLRLATSTGASTAIICSVRKSPLKLAETLRGHMKEVLILGQSTSLPISIKYKTPQTLGFDRVAAAVGAWNRYEGRPLLVVDAGTCITYEFVSRKGSYRGGVISPGISMRMAAMHTFTQRLPLVDETDVTSIPARTTRSSVAAGGVHGAVMEIEGFIRRFTSDYPDGLVTLTGGDHQLIADLVEAKYEIFAVPNLVLEGLNKILEFNDL